MSEFLRLTEPELVEWGERFGAGFREPLAWQRAAGASDAPLVIRLEGELGAGKTTLARAICRGFGVCDEVTSPTFAIIHRYDSAAVPVHHVDLYRVRSAEELTQLGWDEVVSGPGLVLVEWPERAGTRMPKALAIRLAHDPACQDVRMLTLEAA